MSTPVASAPALEVAGLGVRYASRRALQGFDLVVPRGQFVALTGPNGSGKSTLLRACLGLLEPSEGTVRLFGQAVESLSIRERARRVAWVPQTEPLREDVPLARYVLYGRYATHGTFGREGADDARRVVSALESVGLADRAGDGVLSLSGGERQRAVLARALSQASPLLLLDEPTTHLDIGHQLDLLGRVRSLVRERELTAVAALHDLNLAARFADRVVVLSHGRCVADGAPSAVLSAELLSRVWGVDAELRRDPGSGLPYLIPRAGPPTGLPRPRPGRRVHVVAGGGSGDALLRTLFDRGFDVSVGVLPLFDTDATVAQELGIPAVFEVPFAPIGDDARTRLGAILRGADAVVVAAFPVGPANLANLEALLDVPRPAAIVLVAHRTGTAWDFTGGRASTVRDELIRRGATEVEGADRAVDALRVGSPSPPAS